MPCGSESQSGVPSAPFEDSGGSQCGMQTPEFRGLTLAESLCPGDPSPHLTAGTVALGVLGSGVCSRPLPGDPERSALRRPGEAAVLGKAPCSGDPAL